MFGGRSCQRRQTWGRIPCSQSHRTLTQAHIHRVTIGECYIQRRHSLSKFSDLVLRSADAIPSAANLKATFPAHSPYHLSCRANLQHRQTRGFHPLNIRRPVCITASTCLHCHVYLSVSPCQPVRVAMSTCPCRRVNLSVSPCQPVHVAVSPCQPVHVAVSTCPCRRVDLSVLLCRPVRVAVSTCPCRCVDLALTRAALSLRHCHHHSVLHTHPHRLRTSTSHVGYLTIDSSVCRRLDPLSRLSQRAPPPLAHRLHHLERARIPLPPSRT